MAIIAFGIIIAVHELGHYFSAKALNVKVNEFAIGMGPKLLKKQGKETLYTLRALPFGGFCSMEGEHEEDDEPDPRSFLSQKRWKRIVILASGSVANFIFAFVIVFILTSGAQGFTGTTVTSIEGFPANGVHEIRAGDTIVSVNGERLFYANDFFLLMQLSTLNKNYTLAIEDDVTVRKTHIDFTIRRNGELIEMKNFPMTLREYDVDGEIILRYGLSVRFEPVEATITEKIKASFYQMYNFVRMIRLSLVMLFSGSASLSDISGPVGIVSAINTVGQQAPNIGAAILDIISFMAFIGVNVAIINMLPIPAMDGGRILFVVLTWIIEKIMKKQLDPKYEGYVNTGAFVLLIGLMVVVLYNDVMRIIGG